MFSPDQRQDKCSSHNANCTFLNKRTHCNYTPSFHLSFNDDPNKQVSTVVKSSSPIPLLLKQPDYCFNTARLVLKLNSKFDLTEFFYSDAVVKVHSPIVSNYMLNKAASQLVARDGVLRTPVWHVSCNHLRHPRCNHRLLKTAL